MARPREFDEAEVIQQAMIVFWQNGYRGTSVQDLVAATGLNPGSLYGTFGDKHGVFLAALESYMASFLRNLRTKVDQAEDPVEALRDLVRGAEADSQNPASRSRGCMVGNTCSELAATDEIVRQRLEGFLIDLRSIMADALRAGQEQGTFADDRDPEIVATFVQCSLQGLAVLAKSHPDPRIISGVVTEILKTLEY